MSERSAAMLTRLRDTDQVFSDPADDIRGRRVKDLGGEDLGKIDELLVDTDEHRVRLLRVEHGGILGIGASASFIPAEAVRDVTEDIVVIDQSRQRVAAAPPYDPDLVDQDAYYQDLYGYYGYTPFWSLPYGMAPVSVPTPSRRPAP
jgi:sporulation protein YlmC with PRC-barrel domain